MRRHPKTKRRSLAPRLQTLEPRRLLALTATWLGQDGSDFVGAESSLLAQSPNDYQDIHLRLTGLSFPNDAVTRVQVNKFGGGGWTWNATGKKGALFLPDASVPSAGDLYMEPLAADPAGTWYEKIRVDYANGAFEETQLNTATAVDPNLRAAGKQLSAAFQGQVDQDWTGPYTSVGPDGIKDVRVDLSSLSAGADVSVVRLTATSPGGPTRVWEAGVNPNGHWNAELLNRPGRSGTLGTTAELYVSPDVNLAGYSLTLEVVYAHRNPDGSYTNRSGKTDVVIIGAGTTDPNAAMPVVAEANLPQAKATSLPQDEGYPGYSRASLDFASLPSPQSFASVRSAVLSNLHGSSWVYARPGAPAPYTGGSYPLPMTYDAATGVFGFPPVRDEEGSTLTLLLTFDDGGQAVARFDGAPADINRRALDSRDGAPIQNVRSAVELLDKLHAKAPNIHLTAGAYSLDQPLILDYPVRITADPGALLNFNLSNAPGSPWNTATGAIRIASSHVALDGFAIRFQGDSSMWTAGGRFVIQGAGGGAKVNLSLTRLDIQAPAAASTTTYEEAINLMNFEGMNSGRIADNVLKGGYVQLGTGPWSVVGNDYRGALPYTISPTFLNALTSHDLTIRGNHVHAVAPAGITRRFLVFGRSDLGQGIGNLIEGNVIDGGIGTPKVGPEKPFENAPEIILMETYQPRFEGKPSAVSPDGFIVQVPHLRGPSARTGDIVSILSGPHAGEWRMIAQALGPTRYLLNEPMPAGEYTIAIGRGYVDQIFRGNTIDLRDMSPGNAAMVITGNQWGTRVVGNTFLGGNGVDIHVGSNERGFESAGVDQLAPWGWSRLPVLDITIDGNAFIDAPIALAVSHGQKHKTNSGRTYLTGVFLNNRVEWSDPTRPAVTIGVGAKLVDNSDKVIPLDFTLANYPWISLDEIRLTLKNNWGVGSPTGVGPTMRVYAAMLNGVEADDLTLNLPSSPIMAAVSLGQDGSDFVGLGRESTGPDGHQDIHIFLFGLHPDKMIERVVVTGFGGGEWSYNGPRGADGAALFRDGTTADLYIQPRQNEIGSRFTILVAYADGATAQAYVSPVFAMVRPPAVPEPSALEGQSAEPRTVVIDSGGSPPPGAFQTAASEHVGQLFAAAPMIDQSEPAESLALAVPDLVSGSPPVVHLRFAANQRARAMPRQRPFRAVATRSAREAVVRELVAAADAKGRIGVKSGVERGFRHRFGPGLVRVLLQRRGRLGPLVARPAEDLSEPIRAEFRLGDGEGTPYDGMRDRGGR